MVLVLLIATALAWALAQPWWRAAWTEMAPGGHQAAHWLQSVKHTALAQWPAKWNPWAPLTLAEPDGMFTRWKIGRLESDHAACQAWLASTPGTVQTPLTDYAARSALVCGWRNASRILQLDSVRFSSPFTLSCGAAVALARWEHHALQAAAHKHLNSSVVQIDHLGSYACRNIGGNVGSTSSSGSGQLSTHASANALDIAAFTLANGRRIHVLGDWAEPAEGASAESLSGEAQFLRDAHRGACRSFNGVLGPNYNAAHRNHFHLDRGAFRVCR